MLFALRSPSAPARLSREEHKGRECAWKSDLRKSSKGLVLARMQVLLADGVPRTFGHIVLELSYNEYTADVAFATIADDALWARLFIRTNVSNSSCVNDQYGGRTGRGTIV